MLLLFPRSEEQGSVFSPVSAYVAENGLIEGNQLAGISDALCTSWERKEDETQSGFDDGGSVHAVHAPEAASLRHADVDLPAERLSYVCVPSVTQTIIPVLLYTYPRHRDAAVRRGVLAAAGELRNRMSWRHLEEQWLADQVA